MARLSTEPLPPTPLVRYRGDTGGWAAIWLKDETRQLTGAFKVRGCLHKLSALPRGASLVTASTGNHGLGAATAAQLCGHALTVFIPAATCRTKRERLRATAAEIITVEGDYDACEQRARDAASGGRLFVSSFDDEQIIAGHRSLCREVDRELRGADAVFVPVGGGGLLSACALHWSGRMDVVGVELDSAPAMQRSLQRRERVRLDAVSGWAEGLLVRQVGRLPFSLCRALAPEIRLVSEGELAGAIRRLWYTEAIRAEGAGAAALAAALAAPQRGRTCICIVSGGNIDDERFAAALAGERALPLAAGGSR